MADGEIQGTDNRRRIEARLAEIEGRCRIEIFYACEAGSRAMEFASPDSDYDVRFFYRNRAMDAGRDAIAAPIEDGLDVNGWELNKAIGHIAKGNVTPCEWLTSTIRYRETTLAHWLRDAAVKAFDPQAAYRHYAGAAYKRCRIALSGATATPKEYLHAARPLLASLFLLEHADVVPSSLSALVEAAAAPNEVKEALALMILKRCEADARPVRVATLDRWFRKTMYRLRAKRPPRSRSIDTAPLHRLAWSVARG